MKFLQKSIIIFSLLLSFSLIAYAQIPNSIDGIDISSNPENPNPGQNVTISIESYITSLNSASIVWLVDGKNYKKGTGVNSITIIAPEIGKSTNIVVAIMTAEGREVKKTMTINSSSIDIIWESSGYTPPFFEGKSLFAYQNPIKITAIPHLGQSNGKELDQKTLVYKWTVNNKVIQDQSGYGKQTIVLKDELPKTLEIKVEAETKNGSQKSISFITLNPRDPSISFYEEDPLYGILYNKALLNNKALKGQEINIVSAPYYFNVYNNNSPLSYVWSINNLERSELSTSQIITLRSKGDSSGSSLISLEIRNQDDILQGANNSIKVNFNKQAVEDNTTL
ncbi:MAG TPA: hypothetical protein VI775_02545 [Candidatus Paceibacterota bacterium]